MDLKMALRLSGAANDDVRTSELMSREERDIMKWMNVNANRYEMLLMSRC